MFLFRDKVGLHWPMVRCVCMCGRQVRHQAVTKYLTFDLFKFRILMNIPLSSITCLSMMLKSWNWMLVSRDKRTHCAPSTRNLTSHVHYALLFLIKCIKIQWHFISIIAPSNYKAGTSEKFMWAYLLSKLKCWIYFCRRWVISTKKNTLGYTVLQEEG